MYPDYSDNTKNLTEDNGFDPRDIKHVLYEERNPRGTPKRHRLQRKPMRSAMKNWCPDCREYVAQNHKHGESK